MNIMKRKRKNLCIEDEEIIKGIAKKHILEGRHVYVNPFSPTQEPCAYQLYHYHWVLLMDWFDELWDMKWMRTLQ